MSMRCDCQIQIEDLEYELKRAREDTVRAEKEMDQMTKCIKQICDDTGFGPAHTPEDRRRLVEFIRENWRSP